MNSEAIYKNIEQVEKLREIRADARLGETSEDPFNFRRIDLRGKDLSKADLRRVDFFKADLEEINLSEAVLRKAHFHRTNLQKANLEKADLISASLGGADLRWVNLREADLRWANLKLADLRAADLTLADLRAADLTDADFTGANFERVKSDGRTKWPQIRWPGFQYEHLPSLIQSPFTINDIKILKVQSSKVIFPAFDAVEKSQKKEAFFLLRNILREYPDNEQAWLLLAAILEEPTKQYECLRRVLDINSQSGVGKRIMWILKDTGDYQPS